MCQLFAGWYVANGLGKWTKREKKEKDNNGFTWSMYTQPHAEPPCTIEQKTDVSPYHWVNSKITFR